MDHLTEQDAGLLEQGASMLEEHAEEQRTRGNCSAAEGAACSAHAIRRLAPAMLRAGRGCLAQIEEPAKPARIVLDNNWKARMLDGRAPERDEMGLGDHPELPWLDEGMMPRSFYAALGLELAHTMAEDQLDGDALEAMSEAVNWTAWQPTAPQGDGWKLVSIFDTEDGPAAWWLRELPEAEDGTTTIRNLKAEVEKLEARIARLHRAGAAPAAVAPEHPPMPETWAVVASIEGQDVVCISSNALSGKGELTESEEQAVIGMAQHLLAFVGYGLPPCDFDADDEPAPAPALEAPAASNGEQLDGVVRKRLGALLNAFGEAQWQAGRGVPCPSIEDAFEAIISAAVGLLAAAPQDQTDPQCVAAWRQKMQDERKGDAVVAMAFDAGRRAAAAPQAPAAPWKDHLTARLVNDLRDCALKYHGAGQLRERIAHIVVPLCDQLKGALAAPAAPAVDAETIHLQDLKNALADATALRQQLTLMDEQQAGTVWRWQDDGRDQLETMGNRMGVLIYACDLRALLAGAAPAVDALDSDRWRALEGQMDAGRVSLTVHHTEAEQWDGRTISDAGELQDYADSLAAQAKEGGEAA